MLSYVRGFHTNARFPAEVLIKWDRLVCDSTSSLEKIYETNYACHNVVQSVLWNHFSHNPQFLDGIATFCFNFFVRIVKWPKKVD